MSLSIASLFVVVMLIMFQNHLMRNSPVLAVAFIFGINGLAALFLINLKRIKVLLMTIFLSFALYGLIAISFRYVRTFFPKPSLVGSDAIGFMQYFGYPLFFDVILFVVMLIIPIFIYLTLEKKYAW